MAKGYFIEIGARKKNEKSEESEAEKQKAIQSRGFPYELFCSLSLQLLAILRPFVIDWIVWWGPESGGTTEARFLCA